MKPEYQNWIEQNIQEVYGKCAEATIEMAKAFPELKRVRGHYFCFAWGQREHWWLIDPDGAIVDPTATQFPSKGHGSYVEWDESQPEPIGSCINCGGYVFEGDPYPCCCDECYDSYAAEMNMNLYGGL